MLTKNEVKYLKSLHQKKEREEAQSFLCEGDKIVSEAIESGWSVKNVYVTHKMAENYNLKSDFQPVSEKEMEQISALSTAPGIMAVVAYPKYPKPSFEILKG